jgi:PD-(D/E)XK endonuclease
MMEAPFKRGNVSEAVVLSRYTEAGFLISIPFGVGAPYDLVIDTGPELLRVQVKTGRVRNGVIEFETRRTRSRKLRTSYREGEADYFAIYCPELDRVYVTKAREGVFGKLRVRPTGNNQQMFVKWAEDYTFEKHVEALKKTGRRLTVRTEGGWVV